METHKGRILLHWNLLFLETPLINGILIVSELNASTEGFS